MYCIFILFRLVCHVCLVSRLFPVFLLVPIRGLSRSTLSMNTVTQTLTTKRTNERTKYLIVYGKTREVIMLKETNEWKLKSCVGNKLYVVSFVCLFDLSVGSFSLGSNDPLWYIYYIKIFDLFCPSLFGNKSLIGKVKENILLFIVNAFNQQIKLLEFRK